MGVSTPHFIHRLPINMAAVEEVQSQASNLVARSTNTETNIFQERINALRALQKQIYDTERQFYQALNLSSMSDMEAINELQQRIDLINRQTGLMNLVSNGKYKIIADLAPYLTQLSTAALLERIQQPDIMELLMEKTKTDVISDMKDFINALNIAVDNTNKTSEASIGKFAQGDTKFNKTITIKGGKVELADNAPDDPHFSRGVKEKLAATINYLTNSAPTIARSKLTTAEKQQLLYNTISKYVDGEVLPYLEYELFSNFTYYDAYLNEASLKGFFGELQANLVLDLLFAGARKMSGSQNFERIGLALPTGNIKTLIEGQSINIDSVINGFGFQIKNYSMNSDGTVSFKGSNQAGNFIDTRSRVVNGADILTNLFASYQFNQIFTDKSLDPDEAERTYGPIYANFDPIIRRTPRLFQGYIDNILRVSAEFEARLNQQGLFKTEDTYFNTFFLVNSKLVPASLIIEAIIESMYDIEYEDLVQFSLTSYKRTEGSHLQEIIVNGGHKTSHRMSGTGLNVQRYANLVQLNYEIKLNLDKVIHLAETKLK